jgi:hypothetical protein
VHARLRITAAIACLGLAAGACRSAPRTPRRPPLDAAEPIPDCQPHGSARPLCGFQNPEDLAALPGGEAIVVSEYGGMQGEQAGALVLLELASGTRHVLFRASDGSERPSPGFGDPACPGPPTAFSPHGIDLGRLAEGQLVLAVVQHATRESIELFEVEGFGSEWTVAWRGCLIAPDDAWLNDVVWLPDASLVASSMMPRSEGVAAMMRGEGSPGHALHWLPGEGFHEIPGTRGALANGVEVSPDGTKLYLNLTQANEVRRIDLATGKVEGSVAVVGPDNSTWAPDGRLLVASIRALGSEEFRGCDALSRGACPIPYAIVAIDVATMQARDLYVSSGAPMGAGTVGLQVGRELFVGSFVGDRVVRVDLDDE